METGDPDVTDPRVINNNQKKMLLIFSINSIVSGWADVVSSLIITRFSKYGKNK